MTPTDDALDRVRKIIADQLEMQFAPVTATSTFDSLKADSLDMLDIVHAVEVEFDCTIPNDAFAKIKTVSDVVAAVEGAAA